VFGEGVNLHQLCRFIVTYLTLLEDSPLRTTVGPKPRRTYYKFFRELYKPSIIETLRGYASLGDLLTKSSCAGTLGTRQGFLGEMKKTPVFQEYLHYHRTGDVTCYTYVLTFLWFGKKMDYEDEQFNATALRGWQDVEEQLSKLMLPPTDRLAKIISMVLPPPDPNTLLPKHGPGAVSEEGVRGYLKKTLTLPYDAKIDRAFFKQQGFTNSLRYETLASPQYIVPSYETWGPEGSVSRRYSRLKFVRKNIKTSRSICMEPAIYMYFQQLLAGKLSDAIAKSEFGKFITLQDQTNNQRLASQGSITNNIDTLDLKSASDSMSMQLVERVFPREWLYYMKATRTSVVELPDGTKQSVNKFAPMGSALCFPTQCIVFTAICIEALVCFLIDRSGSYSALPLESQIREAISLLSEHRGGSEGINELAVYGDDICVDTKLTPYVTDLLSSYGFTVNVDKSFTADDSFRESCGKFYLGGDDVSPFFYRVNLFGNRTSAKDIANMIGVVNSIPKDMFPKTRKHLLSVLLTHNPYLAFGNKPGDGVVQVDRSGHLWSINPHLKSRWNNALQRREVRVRIPIEVDYEWVEDFSDGPFTDSLREFKAQQIDSYLYLQWIRTAAHREDELSLIGEPRRAVAANIRMIWRWTPDQY
jgi:hypothetical protein